MMDRPDVMLRYQALDMARELLRTDNHSDDLLAEAMRIEAYMLGVAPQQDAQVGVAAGMSIAFTTTEAGDSMSITPKPAQTEALTLTRGATEQADADPVPKERKPRKVKAAKKASGKKRGRPARAEAVAEKDLPIANGANGMGEHVEPPIAEPQPVAA